MAAIGGNMIMENLSNVWGNGDWRGGGRCLVQKPFFRRGGQLGQVGRGVPAT